MIKCIFFDFDGVIVESVSIKTQAFAKLFEKEGESAVSLIVDYHIKNTGVSRYDKFRYFYDNILKRKLDEREFKRLCSEFEKLVLENVVKAPYVSGAKEFLEKYHDKYSICVISATPQKEIEEIIAKRKMDTYFKAVCGAPTLKTDAVRNIITSSRLNGDECLYVGDALSDYKAAKENDVHFIARTIPDEKIFNNINCIKISDLDNLNDLVSRINKTG